MDFIIKLPILIELRIGKLCNSILTINNRLTKWTYLTLTSKNSNANKMTYKVRKTLKVSYRIPKEFMIDRDKLFTSAF